MKTLTTLLITLITALTFTACEPGNNASVCASINPGIECFVDEDVLRGKALEDSSERKLWNKSDLEAYGPLGTNEAFNVKRTILSICLRAGVGLIDGINTDTTFGCYKAPAYWSPEGEHLDIKGLPFAANDYFGTQGLFR